MRATKLQERDRKEIRKLERDGRLQTSDVVEAARPKTSPLHRHFEWDDKKCGIKHRLDQARKLIEAYTMEIVVEDVVVEPPYYVRDVTKAANEQGYIALTKLQEDRKNAMLTLKMEANRVESSLQRARNIAVTLGLNRELENMLSGILVSVQRLLAA